MIKLLAEGSLKTKFGIFNEKIYYDGSFQSISIGMGNLRNSEDVLCRVHSHCVSAHIFNSVECDCREQMAIAQNMIAEEGKGLIIWLDQDGRGNGHMAKLLTTELKRNGMGQSEAFEKLGYPSDNRNYSVAAQIINALKINSIKLITNNPEKKEQLTKFGVKVNELVPAFIERAGNDLLLNNMKDKVESGHKIKISE